jgi:hypothetical protein
LSEERRGDQQHEEGGGNSSNSIHDLFLFRVGVFTTARSHWL